MITLRCQCSRTLSVRPEFAGRKTRCPGCGTVLQIPAASKTGPEPPRPKPPAARSAAPPPATFPGVGVFLGWLSIAIGVALILFGLIITVITSDGGFKPAGLMVFSFPGVLWCVCGVLLLQLQRRFVTPFWIFLGMNNLVGVFFTTQGRSLGSASDAQIFAVIGLGFILGSILVGLVHGLLTRDVRRAASV